MKIRQLTSKRLAFAHFLDAVEDYFERGWTDGLPIVPPEEQLVQIFLDCTNRSPSEIIGTDPVKGTVITVEKVVINAVMAGCRPEYLPVVLSSIEAICQPQFNLHAVSSSTMGAAVLVVVGGPIAETLGINSKVNLFGPGNRANATIGRAIRLVMINAVGAVPAVLDKATLGQAGKYTWCFSESDYAIWKSLHVHRGFKEEQSTVTVFGALPPIQISNHEAQHPEDIFKSFLDAMFVVGPAQEELLIVICPEHAGYIKEYGWSRNDVQEHLFDKAKRSVGDWTNRGFNLPNSDSRDIVSVINKPEGIVPLVAGGAAGAFSSVVGLWGGGSNSKSVTRVIS